MNQFDTEMSASFDEALSFMGEEVRIVNGPTIQGIAGPSSLQTTAEDGGVKSISRVEIQVKNTDVATANIKKGTILQLPERDGGQKYRVATVQSLTGAQKTLICGPVNRR